VVDLAGDDLVLCQITRKARSDDCTIPLVLSDFERGLLAVNMHINDDVMEIKIGRPADIRRTRHLGHFTNWKDHDAYQKAFAGLLSDLTASELGEP
jgi:hypothetical protein